jgi:hypothetical protein
MEKLVLNVQLIKDGMEQNVLIDVQMEEYGILLHQHVDVQWVNHGMDIFVLPVLIEKHGI